jgi:CRISPR-associated protein Csx3
MQEKRMQPLKVVLCGPPHSGKSCLREGLKQALMVEHRLGNAPYPYVLTACPDGEGAWYSEAAWRDAALARQWKDAYKSRFTEAFARNKAREVAGLSLPLSLIDVGGKIDEKNRWIMAEATHAVILAGDMARVAEWKSFCEELGLGVIAIIESDYSGKVDRVDSETPMVTGVIHYLERGEDVSERLMVKVLVRVLVGMCG